MIHASPILEPIDHRVADMIRAQRIALNHRIAQNPNRWTGVLRRSTFARAIQGSNSIEGYNATLADAGEIVDEARPDMLAEETAKALEGYRTAMTYILRVHDDPHTHVDTGFIRSLHFMMLSHDLSKLPGQWRTGDVFIVHEPTGDRVYEGPDADLVPGLMDALVAQIDDTATGDALIRGAMAHLNLAMIHPFRNGNGRMARALQTLVLARDGVSSPVFSSIEEWLGRNTLAYYDVLAQVGRGSWHPENDALPWVRFCLKAHYQQAATIVRRNEEMGRMWTEIHELTAGRGLPERCELALIDAALGFRVRNGRYRKENEISEVVASRDLKRLCDAGLLEAVGEKRGRYYVAAAPLLAVRDKCRDRRAVSDPYTIARNRSDSAAL